MLTLNFQWIGFSYFKLHLQLKDPKYELHELHGNVHVEILFLLEVMARCGCCQEKDLTWRRLIWFSMCAPLRCLSCRADSSKEQVLSTGLLQATVMMCRTAQKVHSGITNFKINIPYYCFSFILTLFLPPAFLCPNLLLTDLITPSLLIPVLLHPHPNCLFLSPFLM